MVPRNNDAISLLSCQGYPDDSPFDAYLWTARIMSILAPLFCLFGMSVAYIAEVGTPIKQECRLLTSILFMLIASTMQALTLMILESAVCKDNANMPGDGTCGLGYGSKIALGAVSLMSIATFGLLVTGRKEIERETNNPASSVASNSMPEDIYLHDENVGVASDDQFGDLNDPAIQHGSGRQGDLAIQHGSGRFKFVDVWGRLV